MPATAELVDRARDGDPRAVARLISQVEDASPALREVMSLLIPHAGRAAVLGVTGSPGVGKSTTTSALVTAFRADGRRVGVLAVDPSSPFSGGACSVTGYACRSTPPTPGSTSGPWPPVDTWAVSPGPHPRRCGCWTPPGATSSSSRPWASVSPRWRWPRSRTRRWCCSRPAWATGSRPRRRGSSKSGTCSSSTRPTATARIKSSATCAAPSGWRSGSRGIGANRSSRPSPSAEGMAELIEAIDKHRDWMERSGELARRRRRRVRDEIEAIAATALRRRFGDVHGDARLDVLAEKVLTGELDPYAAADEIIEAL